MFTKSFHQILFYQKNEKKQPFHTSARRPAETPVGGRLHGACPLRTALCCAGYM